MAGASHDKAQFGRLGQPDKHGLTFVRSTIVPRAISGIISGGGGKSPAAILVSNIGLKSPTARHARFMRLSLGSAVLPIFTDTVDAGGSINIPPVFLGTANGLLHRPRLWTAKAYMNVKFGPKTRPC
jgi:hypothetical protein